MPKDGDWESGSQVVTHKGREILRTEREISVEQATALVAALREAGIVPIDGLPLEPFPGGFY